MTLTEAYCIGFEAGAGVCDTDHRIVGACIEAYHLGYKDGRAFMRRLTTLHLEEPTNPRGRAPVYMS